MATNPIWNDTPGTPAQKAGLAKFSQPFNGDKGQYLLEQPFTQFLSDFTVTPLNTVHPDFPTYFLVNEGPLEDQGGGLVRWTRTYAQVPANRSDYESFSWLVPGLAAGGAGVQYAITGYSQVGSSTQITLASDASADFAVGKSVGIFYTASYSAESTYQIIRNLSVRISGTIWQFAPDFTPPVGVNFTPRYAAINSLFSRQPRQTVVSSRVDKAYFLPGVTAGITTPSDIPVTNPVRIFDQNGVETQIYSGNTTPTQAAYQAQITAKTYLLVEGTVLKRWKGNIYESSVRFAQAQ